MKAKILILLVIVTIVNACSKNADAVKPELSFGSVNGTRFNLNSNIIFNLTLKNATTGIAKDTLFIARKFFTCPFITTDTTFYKIPEYNGIKNQKATIEYSFQYGGGGKFNGCINNSGSASRTDSLNYFFWVKDSNGKSSDTIKSPKIILLR